MKPDKHQVIAADTAKKSFRLAVLLYVAATANPQKSRLLRTKNHKMSSRYIKAAGGPKIKRPFQKLSTAVLIPGTDWAMKKVPERAA